MSLESNLSRKEDGSRLASAFVERGYVVTAEPPSPRLIADLLAALETVTAASAAETCLADRV